MSRGGLLLLLCACGAAPPPRSVETTQGPDLEVLWSDDSRLPARPREGALPPAVLPVALPWGAVLYAKGDEVVCAEELTGRRLWGVEADIRDRLQAGACRDEVILLEPGGYLRSFTREGKSLGRAPSADPLALLVTAPDRVYVWTADGADAYDPATLRHVWNWRPFEDRRCLGVVAQAAGVAVVTLGPPVPQPETLVLEFESGVVRGRFIGTGLGWHEGRLFLLKRDEVWVRDGRTNEFLEARRLDAFDGGFAALHEGRVLFSGVNRYFTDGCLRVRRDGATEVAQEVVQVRDVHRESEWRRPLSGAPRLIGDIIIDAGDGKLSGVWAYDGAFLWEWRAGAGLRGLAVGPRCLFLLTGDGRLTAVRYRRA